MPVAGGVSSEPTASEGNTMGVPLAKVTVYGNVQAAGQGGAGGGGELPEATGGVRLQQALGQQGVAGPLGGVAPAGSGLVGRLKE